MSSTTLEQRVAALETQYAELLKMVQSRPASNAWRKVVGMFGDDPRIDDLHRETIRIREVDRANAHEASQGEP